MVREEPYYESSSYQVRDTNTAGWTFIFDRGIMWDRPLWTTRMTPIWPRTDSWSSLCHAPLLTAGLAWWAMIPMTAQLSFQRLLKYFFNDFLMRCLSDFSLSFQLYFRWRSSGFSMKYQLRFERLLSGSVYTSQITLQWFLSVCSVAVQGLFDVLSNVFVFVHDCLIDDFSMASRRLLKWLLHDVFVEDFSMDRDAWTRFESFPLRDGFPLDPVLL